jgi:transitional endoplasmic reticulum ATPase
VIFEEGGETGLYRYLLTLLDGLESETAGRVCVMMTAMNIHNLPPALIRSGRIELWLEMRLPNEFARTEILQSYLSQIALVLRDADIPQLVAATDGFTGADLKRLIEEGKTLYAYDFVQAQTLKSPTEYFLAAIEVVLTNKQRYAEAEDLAQQADPQGHQLPNRIFKLDRLQRSWIQALRDRRSDP